jgi:hypothetical protein
VSPAAPFMGADDVSEECSKELTFTGMHPMGIINCFFQMTVIDLTAYQQVEDMKWNFSIRFSNATYC